MSAVTTLSNTGARRLRKRLGVCRDVFRSRPPSLSLSNTLTQRETTGVTGLGTRRALYQKAKKHIHTQTSRFPRVAAAVGVIPSDNGNLTPLGGPSSFIYRAHQKRHTGHPLAAGPGARTRYLLCNATT